MNWLQENLPVDKLKFIGMLLKNCNLPWLWNLKWMQKLFPLIERQEICVYHITQGYHMLGCQ